MRRQHGMTLVEMIVALAITVVLVAICARCLALASDTRGRTESRLSSMENVLRAQQLLRRVVHELSPYVAEDAAATARPRLLGVPDALEIEAPHPARGPAAGRYRIHLEFTPAAGTRGTLALRLESMSEHGRSVDPDAIELCADVARPVFEYLSEAGWQDAWSGADIPQLVRIAAGDPSDARACWPELILAPRVDERRAREDPSA